MPIKTLNESETDMKEMLTESETVMKELLSDEFLRKLETLAKEKAEEYKNNKPFPHIYFDNFLPAEAAEAALREFPEPKQLTWSEFNNTNEKKLAFDVVEKLPSAVRDVLYFLNSRPMLQFLEVLTGIRGRDPRPILYWRRTAPDQNAAASSKFTRTSTVTLNLNLTAASTYWSISTKTGMKSMADTSSYGIGI